MKSMKRYFKTLSVLLLVLSLAACGGKSSVTPEDVENEAFDDMRTEVRESIVEQDQQAVVLAHIDGLQADFKALSGAFKTRRSKLRELNADYDATREQFMEYLAFYDGEIIARHEEFRAERKVLIAATTPEEWADIAKTTTKSMKTLAQLLKTT